MSSRRGRWWGIAAGALGCAALVGLAHAATPSVPEQTAAATANRDTVTYEVTGPREATEILYGDVFDLIFNPYVATSVDRAALPWRVTVPLTGAPSLHDLSARSSDPTPITCTVRRGSEVISTQTAVGLVGCDSTP